MERFEIGMMVISRAGHDAGKRYLIVGMEGEMLCLVDGAVRTKENPKKKNKKHVQVIRRCYQIDGLSDVEIKRLIKVEGSKES